MEAACIRSLEMSMVQTKTSPAGARAAPSGIGGALVWRQLWWAIRVVRQAAACVGIWHRRARERRHLEALSDHMLRDIGLSRADVMAEATKPFWQR
jgi:uncharacterized protein YjiS (DUF1127 family)